MCVCANVCMCVCVYVTFLQVLDHSEIGKQNRRQVQLDGQVSICAGQFVFVFFDSLEWLLYYLVVSIQPHRLQTPRTS